LFIEIHVANGANASKVYYPGYLDSVNDFLYTYGCKNGYDYGSFAASVFKYLLQENKPVKDALNLASIEVFTGAPVLPTVLHELVSGFMMVGATYGFMETGM